MTKEIDQAVEILRAGGLVAFPTETVYGLGADATNPAAVQRIFSAKGRPPTNPVIVHVSSEEVARRYAKQWPTRASDLAAKFWPGPLTLVVVRGLSIVPEVSAGRDTVGLRAPDHPLAMELLRAFDGPVAAPSANRSTRVSPTTAAHVREELDEAVDLILDGGPCRVGIESTVLDLTGQVPTILRPGAVSLEQIASVVGRVEMFRGSVDPAVSAASPGQHAIHYAPRTPAYRFDRDEFDRAYQWCRSANGPVAWLCISAESLEQERDALTFSISRKLRDRPAEYAHELYSALRDLDASGAAAILVEMPPDEPEWAAVRDRLIRATRALPRR